MKSSNAVFEFYAVSDFDTFCTLTRSEPQGFTDRRYQCLEHLDFCKVDSSWYLSRGIPSSAAEHCSSLEHGRPIRGCRVHKGGWIYLRYNHKDFAAIPYAADGEGHKIALFYDLTWLPRLPGIVKTGDTYRISNLCDQTITELPANSCLIPGSLNPSHFVEHFVRHEILATCSAVGGFAPIAIETARWQKSLIERLNTSYLDGLQELRGLVGDKIGIRIMQFRDGFIFEDVPQWLGLQHARRIIRQMCIADPDNDGSGIVYLCRARAELENGHKRLRVEDYVDVCREVSRHGGMIVFPEMHTPAQVQRLIGSSDTVIADAGSCNIHALWSPLLGPRQGKRFYQLTPIEPFISGTHDASRSFEWFCNLAGSRFSFVFGRSGYEQSFSGSVRTACYKEAINAVLGGRR